MVEFRFARFAPGTIPCRDHGPLAQLAERRADNAEVGGSSPPRPTPIQHLSITRTRMQAPTTRVSAMSWAPAGGQRFVGKAPPLGLKARRPFSRPERRPTRF